MKPTYLNSSTFSLYFGENWDEIGLYAKHPNTPIVDIPPPLLHMVYVHTCMQCIFGYIFQVIIGIPLLFLFILVKIWTRSDNSKHPNMPLADLLFL